MHKLKIEILGKVQLSHNKVIADSPLCQIWALTHDSSCTCRLLLARCDKNTNEIHCHRNTGHWTVEIAYIQQKSFEIQHLLKKRPNIHWQYFYISTFGRCTASS